MKGRSQFHSTGHGISESEPERQRIEKEEERLRMEREAEQQRVAQEDERLRNAREAEQRLAREESEQQRVTQEQVDSEKQRVVQEAERQRKAQEGIEAETQRKAQEEAEKKKRDDDLKRCLQAAEEAYSANWDRACRQIDGPPKCILPPLVLARFDGPRQDARDECAKLYPVK
jgi:DNA-binding helix-hairpin-helix protein with protein kinase domain